MPVSDTLGYMLLIMITSMLVMEFVPKLPFKGATLLPSSLLAILSAIFIEYAIVRNVGGRTDVIGDVTPFEFTYPVTLRVHVSHTHTPSLFPTCHARSSTCRTGSGCCSTRSGCSR